ncbi:hypothetical protein OB236_35260 [Paenibacillus sp. WQ 127069]|uniref:RNA polymerase sigma factor 70 region 4 type 2 domain-containing protein n=1 Tax=Paenibacillus baimaensis TaxID=2982185 RepID=A0ABT2URZ8_9BACL|nr:sigma factor-like helix-turn-helix DNA-binding protein [Paenibacillus sp. WQ 127069]MCU6797400.1 hypothetical protein [Paenibacillus sp. WQ 127069]
MALLQTLPPRQRTVLILKDVFEWSSKQITETKNPVLFTLTESNNI